MHQSTGKKKPNKWQRDRVHQPKWVSFARAYQPRIRLLPMHPYAWRIAPGMQGSRHSSLYWSPVVFHRSYGMLTPDIKKGMLHVSHWTHLEHPVEAVRHLRCHRLWGRVSDGIYNSIRSQAHRRLAVCSMLTTLEITRNLSWGTFNQVLNAEIICPRISFPRTLSIYEKGSRSAYRTLS